MTLKTLTLDLPEDLLTKAEAQQLDLRQIMIDALSREIVTGDDVLSLARSAPKPYPSVEEVEQAIRESERVVASGTGNLRILGLHKGSMWLSDDFDDPLPDEFWFGGETT
jgi:hypothetical protein